jgi:O-antigen/teichoic acid export membrane protein
LVDVVAYRDGVGSHQVRLRLATLSLAVSVAYLVAYVATVWFLRYAPGIPRLTRPVATVAGIVPVLVVSIPLNNWLQRIQQRSKAYGLVTARVHGRPAFVAPVAPGPQGLVVVVEFGSVFTGVIFGLLSPNNSPAGLACVAILAAGFLFWAAYVIALGPRLVFTARSLRMPWLGFSVAIPWRMLAVLAPDAEHDGPESIAILWRTVSPGWHRIRTGGLIADRDLLYRAIQHYIRHPEARASIGTQQELDRLRTAARPQVDSPDPSTG